MERAVAYIRVSELRQVVDGNSLVSQENLVRDYAERKGYEFAGLWIEEGETAKTADRPVLQRLLKDLASRKDRAQVLIIPKIDRFARYVEDYTALKAKLKRLSIRLESVGENLEDTPVGRFTEMVLASVAQFDNEIRAERCKGGMLQAVREGRWVWKAPLGLRNVRIGNGGKKGGIGTIEPHPKEAALVRHAFERVAARDRHSDVRRWLERQGLKMTPSTFGTMLRNKAYVGLIEAFGEVNRATPPFTPIIDANLFREVQISLAGGREVRSYERDNPEFALRGTARCECGTYMWASWAHGQKKRYPYFRCHNCARVNIQRKDVNRAFIEELKTFLPHPDWIDERKKDAAVIWQLRQAEKPLRLADIDQALKEIESLSDALALKTARGVVPEATAKRQFDAFEVEKAELEKARQKYRTSSDTISAVVEFAAAFLTNLAYYWEHATLPNQKKLQSFFYPSGLVYQKDGSFRTLDYPLLEQIKVSLRTSNSSLVDPRDENPNLVLDWLSQLYDAFHGQSESEGVADRRPTSP